MNQRKTNTLLFITVIALAIMILLLIISQAGKGNTSTANSGGKGTSRGLADHLKGTSSSTENAETPSTNAPPVTAPINNQPPGGSVTESNAPAVVPPATNYSLPLSVRPSQPQARLSQPQARPSQPQFFGTRSKGNRLVFIIDKSGSMSGSRLQNAKKELIRTLRSLNFTNYFFIFFYDNVARPMPAKGLIRANQLSKNQAIAWIGNVPSSGGTDPTGAIRGAFQMKASTIWLLTDGQFSSDVAALCRQFNSGTSRFTHVRINTVAFGSDSRVLKQIAKENDGAYVLVK